jgi:hypothetical protein
MCVTFRREYAAGSVSTGRAAHFAGAAVLSVLTPADWQISQDVELAVEQCLEAFAREDTAGSSVEVEVVVHATHVEIAIGSDAADWVTDRVRLRPRRPFATAVACRLPGPRPEPAPRPTLWPALATRSDATWAGTYEALHEVTQSIRLGVRDLIATLDAVAAGVVKATPFTFAVVNLVRTEGERIGDFEVVAAEGDAELRKTMLGVVEPAALWGDLIARGRRWGSLRFLPGTDPLPSNTVMTTWVPADAPAADEPFDPDRWNPLDALIAPLYSSEGLCLGALSVDLPATAPRPDAGDLERLEVFADHAASAIERARSGNPD